MERWSGKVAIVSGASRGIGACLTEKLVNAGLLVVGLARKVELIEEHAKQLSNSKGKLYARRCDMTVEQDIIDAIAWTTENVGPVHVLVNNAGVMPPTTLIDGDTAVWRTVLETNVLSYGIATREALKVMKKNGISGHIVHMNSLVGVKAVNLPGGGMYSASKFALASYHECLRQELNMQGLKIKLTSIHPGYVKTEFNDSNEVLLDVLKDVPHLTKYDVADTIVFALSTPAHVQIHEVVMQAVGETF